MRSETKEAPHDDVTAANSQWLRGSSNGINSGIPPDRTAANGWEKSTSI